MSEPGPNSSVGDRRKGLARQRSVVLSGGWSSESMDGVRVEHGPGEFSFSEDQGYGQVESRNGLRSWAVGDQPSARLTAQLQMVLLRELPHAR